ncbi:MAG: M12 family metallo-peptidase, partial [Propionibacteriaceae bacterium]|nr:M12 family metallo-peptidase [Propionibacteriaceae bacterium]
MTSVNSSRHFLTQRSFLATGGLVVALLASSVIAGPAAVGQPDPDYQLATSNGLTGQENEAGSLTAASAQPGIVEAAGAQVNGWAGLNPITTVFLSPDGQPVLNANDYRQLVDQAIGFWTQQTGQQLTFTTSAYDQIPVVTTGNICGRSTSQPAQWAAAALGYDSYAAWRAQQSATSHLLIIRPYSRACGSTYYSVGSANGQIVVLTVDPTGSAIAPGRQAQDLIHELGHNFGLQHTAGATCPAGVSDLTSQCSWTEYGDLTNMMANSHPSFGLTSGQKYRLGLLGSTQTTALDITGQTQLTMSYQLIPGPNQGAAGRQTVTIRDHAASGAVREYGLQYLPTAGGVVIHRLHQADDPETNSGVAEMTDSTLLKPGTTTINGPSAFAPGDSLAAVSGNFRVHVTRADANATVVITTDPQYQPTLPSVADDYPNQAAAGRSWDLTATPTISGYFSQAEDHDWLTLTAPETGPF